MGDDCETSIWRDHCRAKDILNAVERWAIDYWMGRETGCVLKGKGRLDAFLVPSSERCTSVIKNGRFGIIGVEVKVTRSDFQKGLNTGQYDRYYEDTGISGLFLATPKGLVKTSEIPKHIGHIVVNTSKPRRGDWTASCRRNPTFKTDDTPSDVLWRLLMFMQYDMRAKNREMQYEYGEKLNRIGDLVGSEVFSAIRRFEKKL